MPVAAALRSWLAAPQDVAALDRLRAAAGADAVDASAVTRLSVAAITALRTATVPRFDGLRPCVRQAALICGLGKALVLAFTPDEAREAEVLPFTVATIGNELILELQPASHSQRFGSPFLHQWAAGIQADAMVIDCIRLNHVNSVLIAWMLQIVQSAKPVPVRIRHTKPQVATQLKQLRLDHLMTIE